MIIRARWIQDADQLAADFWLEARFRRRRRRARTSDRTTFSVGHGTRLKPSLRMVRTDSPVAWATAWHSVADNMDAFSKKKDSKAQCPRARIQSAKRRFNEVARGADPTSRPRLEVPQTEVKMDPGKDRRPARGRQSIGRPRPVPRGWLGGWTIRRYSRDRGLLDTSQEPFLAYQFVSAWSASFRVRIGRTMRRRGTSIIRPSSTACTCESCVATCWRSVSFSRNA